MIAADYGNKSKQLDMFVPAHLSDAQQKTLLGVLRTYSEVFNGQLGTLPGNPVSLRLKSQNVVPYHGSAFPVPKIYETLFKHEVQRRCDLGVLQKINSSEWAAPSFGIPKKNGQIRVVSDFRQLNKHLVRLAFPLPNPQQLFRTMDGFSYCTTMDLNMGFWTITSDKESKIVHNCTTMGQILVPTSPHGALLFPRCISGENVISFCRHDRSHHLY
jgi:hypothetical protein